MGFYPILEADAGITAMETAAEALLSMVGNVYTQAISHPILMIPIAATVVATGIGLFRSLTGTRRRGRR